MITVSKLKWIDTNSNEEMNYYWKNMYTKQATPQEEKEKEDGINESESSCKTSKVATVESQISNGGASSEKEESTKANEKNLQQEKKKRQLDDFAVVVECRRIEWPADTPNRAEVGLESQLRAKRWLKEIVEGEYIAAKAMELTVPLYPGAYWCMETEAEAWEWIKDAVKEKHISLDDRISITEIFSINPDHCFFERLAELQALTKFLIGMFKPVRIFKEISNGEKRIKGWEMFERLKELKENRETIQRVVKRRQDWPMRRAMQKEAERIMEQDRMTWGHSHPSEKSTKYRNSLSPSSSYSSYTSPSRSFSTSYESTSSICSTRSCVELPWEEAAEYSESDEECVRQERHVRKMEKRITIRQQKLAERNRKQELKRRLMRKLRKEQTLHLKWMQHVSQLCEINDSIRVKMKIKEERWKPIS
ncbi:uncharacterized protein MONOS_2288 [Monocercomonoides exilis]|uniref:uncharacterized protein n=1 Tax=Monocercomonoides exilis TaxID=2049356 RepID=UPI00355A6184|nr:hypothetical protein MONOS_2288 [Monocercomonoides exilis]|eukprot:MONOS_2288.1-p1 / transcript=MONOS_2288.1 / gene=MONOS_2288 / organism=Monocercomonoides_exilis_PA203 / gene_product=unspecified product / transcript_product=unspecified product / location=Mono_scaffold00046:103108-105180(-) / protein_length=421 / sequence_SO=supercontig / SO=protein_coding / is_pseudo=false